MFKDFKPVLLILLRFLAIYLVPVLLYQLYLNHYVETGLDPVSKWVAEQSAAVQNFLGYKTSLEDVPQMETTRFHVNGMVPSRMVEGCNAVSVINLKPYFYSPK